jgi:ribonuclease HII
MMIAGIDEAGRGPVLGPMVMTICALDDDKMHLLEELGVKDSKLIPAKKRDELFSKIQEICVCKTIMVSPQEIDIALLDRSINLNRLEARTTAALINTIPAEISKCIVDCPSINIKAYSALLESMLLKKITLQVEHKADLNNVIVGAASIIAKVTRDREITRISEAIGIAIGSGYPSDPVTMAFLKENWNKYDFFRKTWAPYKECALFVSQQKLGDF